MEININSGYGSTPLKYPHWTKKTDKTLSIVTTPDNLISIGDILFDGFKDAAGESYWAFRPVIVTGVIQQRSARGEHSVASPIFQLLQIKPRPEEPGN